MSVSTANVTPTNISLSPMQVNYNGVDLGGTAGGVDISIKYDMADIHVDQFGKSVIDKVVSGVEFHVKTTLAEIKNKDNWKVAFPSAYEVTSSTKGVYFTMAVGDHLLSHAEQLVLHPLEAAASDHTTDYTFYKAVATEVSEVKYGPDKQVGLSVQFVILPDTSVSPAQYMYFGDTTVGRTAASAGAPALTGTGNGTIDTVAVTNGVTKTETITVKCVGASSGNDFYVSGSLSGALGECHVAATSASSVNFTVQTGSLAVISFTLHQGTVQFAVNDSFTIATTASNYS